MRWNVGRNVRNVMFTPCSCSTGLKPTQTSPVQISNAVWGPVRGYVNGEGRAYAKMRVCALVRCVLRDCVRISARDFEV